MTSVIIILFAWYGKALSDSIRFAKGGEDCYEIWHLIEWIKFWGLAGWFMWVTRMPIGHVLLVVIGSFGFNLVYRTFRYFDVYKWDNKIRIPFLYKILKRDGII